MIEPVVPESADRASSPQIAALPHRPAASSPQPAASSSQTAASPPQPTASFNREAMERNVGFCCALVAIALILTLSVPAQIVVMPIIIPVPLLLLAATMVFMLSAARANDLLISPAGLITLKLCLLGGGLSVLLFLTDTLIPVGIIGSAAFITTSALLWGSSLAFYERTEMLFATALSLVVAGVVLVIALNLNPTAGWILAATAAGISGSIAIIGKIDPIQQSTSIAVSRSRGSAGKGNYFTIIAIAMSMSVSALMGYHLPLAPFITAALMGGSIVVAGILTCLLRIRFKQSYENLARRSIAACATFSLLSYPFADAPLQAVCTCVLLMSFTINCIILIDAIAETARLKRVSPYWIIGNEGTLFMVGALVAFALFWFCLVEGTAESAVAVCLASAVAFVALQVFIEGQSYPYFEMEEEEEESWGPRQQPHPDALAAGGGAKWRERLDEVSANYKLSPRQQEVMRLLLKGRDVKYIMNKFVISQATARTHVYNLYKKLDVHSRRELMDLIERFDTSDPRA